MTNSASSQSMPYLGRCKECDYALSATEDQVKPAESFKEVRANEGPRRVGNNGVFARCPNRHKVFNMRRIEGKFNPEHKCDSRCLNAKGWECTCACGGANHGRGYAVEIVNAANLPSATPTTPSIDADRHKTEVTHVEDAPTDPQLDYLATLAEELGELPLTPSTRAAASELINDLKARVYRQRETQRDIQAQSDSQPVSRPMTDKQESFINKLMDEREMPLEARRAARQQLDSGLTTTQASQWIKRLLELPEISD